MAKKKFFLTGMLLSVASAVGVTYLLRRFRKQPTVELYFNDGSMLALNGGSSELSSRIVAMTEELLRQSP